MTPDWYKLTPDITGGYVRGTWSKIASLPIINGTQYAPTYYASAVLQDGRFIIIGGEYNGSSVTQTETNMGAIYDPVSNAWTAVSAPIGWKNIGDAPGVVLANGTFMLGGFDFLPYANAIFNPHNSSWTATGAPVSQSEQGYTLLPSSNVLTVDVGIWSGASSSPTSTEQYVPSSGTWLSAGNTPVSLVDPVVCGNYEIGPALLRPDETVVAFGGNTGCAQASSSVDPTAIYDSIRGTWSSGPNVPSTCGANGNISCSLADAPAALLPNGNILFAASAGFALPPTHFFELTSANVINQVSDTISASNESDFVINFLVLPSGQILSTDFSNTPEVYTSTGAVNASWAPVISTAPSSIKVGTTFLISGFQFNGLSQGAAYGDEVQTSTNYPIVQIANTSSGHAFYARTFNHSTMSVAPNTPGSTNFTVPANIETGPSVLTVIANGIASHPISVMVTGTVSQTILFIINPSTPTVGSTGTISLPNGAYACWSSSCLPVTFTSVTPNICTVNSTGLQVVFNAAGICTIAANQSGNSSYSAAPQVIQSINVISQSDCVFNWAEQAYSRYFTPAGSNDATYATYTYRYYSGTGIYLTYSSTNREIYVLGASFGNNLVDVGSLSSFLGTSGCQ